MKAFSLAMLNIGGFQDPDGLSMRELPGSSVPLSERVSTAFASAGLGSAREGAAPSVVIIGGEPRVAWANRAAAHLLDVSGYDELNNRLLGFDTLSSRRLRDLVATSRPGVHPRLERLRFSWGVKVLNLTALCARGEDIDGVPTLLVSFVGAQADKAAHRADWLEEIPGRSPLCSNPEPAAPQPLPRVPAQTLAVEAAPPGEHPPPDIEPLRSALRAALGDVETGRFVWKTNEEGALVQIDEGLMRKLGLALVHDEQVTLVQQIAGLDPVAAERLDQALAERATWSGIEALLPLGDGSSRLPLVLAGSPLFDVGRRFLGYRGFGRFTIASLLPASASPAPPVRSAMEAMQPLSWPQTIAPPRGDQSSEVARPVLFPPDDPGAEVSAPFGQDGSLDDRRPAAPFVMVDRSANVVQLWPLQSPLPGRVPHVPKAFGGEDHGSGSAAMSDRPAAIIEGDQRSSIEAAVGRSLERKGALTSSEHQAFQEIGKALGPGPRRAPPSPVATHDDKSSRPVAPVPPPPGESDFTRHAAALVEHMTAGLLVVRNKRVLFANEALREALRFDSHSELMDALALQMARRPTVEVSPDGTLSLPSAYGDDVHLVGVSRSIPWNGQPATLWTLSDPAARSVSVAAEVTRSGEVSPVADDEASDLSPALDMTGEAIAVVDMAGRIQWMNAQAERYFGRPREHATGEAFTDMLAPESRAAATALLHQVKANPNPKAQCRGECVGRSADGSSLPLEMRLATLDNRRIAIVWRDLSAYKMIERDLAQARRQGVRADDRRPDFLAIVSHQIRTPLTAMLGFTEIMMDERFGPLGNSRYKDYLKDIQDSGTQVISLIDDLMDLSRIEAGQLDLRVSAIDINKIIADCVSEVHALAHRERIIVRTSFASRLPLVMVDDRSARQIVGNLLSNAIKFNEPGGQVIVSTALNDSASVVVRIRDTGIGMSDHDIASALEPFRQLAPTKNTSGTGLGLPLTKALVGANGASLSIRSRPSEGTLVEVTFQSAASLPARVPA